jgi:hypothetical protein
MSNLQIGKIYKCAIRLVLYRESSGEDHFDFILKNDWFIPLSIGDIEPCTNDRLYNIKVLTCVDGLCGWICVDPLSKNLTEVCDVK